MKGALVILVFILLSVSLCGQGFAVSADKMNVAYIGVDNLLTIVAEGCDCSKLEVTTANGTIQKTADCEYNFKPITAGNDDIAVKVKTTTGVKKLGSVTYRIKNIPDPVASLQSTGYHGRNLSMTKGIVLRTDGFDFATTFVVKDFTFEVERKGKIIHTIINEGNLYSEQVKNVIRTLYPGDRIFITHVRCVGPDKIIRQVNAITYVLY